MPVHEFTIKEEELIAFKRRRYVRQAVQTAVSKGELFKPNCCELCKEKCNPQSHHVDYGKPLQVVWLCAICHGKVHRKDHVLNPNNNPQTPLPAHYDRYKHVTVAFKLPVRNFLALQAEAEKLGKPIGHIIKNQTLEKFPVREPQLKFQFEERVNDESQSIVQPRVQSVAENESLLPQSKSPILQEVRRKRNLNLSGMDDQLFAVLGGYGSNSAGVQRHCVAR